MFPFYSISNSNPEKMSSQMHPTFIAHHPPDNNGFPAHFKAESSNFPQMCGQWSHSYGPSPPPYHHTCCNPSSHPGYCTFQPPQLQYPPPPMPHAQCYGGCPVYSEPYRYPYPGQYMPQPHCTPNLPRYEYDKCMPMGYHCCGCPHHPSRMRGDRTLKIEEHEPEAEMEDSQSPTTSLRFQRNPYPVVWFPAENIKGREYQKQPHSGPGKQVGDYNLISGQVPSNAGNEPKVWNGWVPVDMNNLKQLMPSGDEKRDQNLEDSGNALAPLQSSRNTGTDSQPNAWSGWLPLDIDTLRRLMQQQDGKSIKDLQSTSNQTDQSPADVPGCDDTGQNWMKGQKDQSEPSSSSSVSKITPTQIQQGVDILQKGNSFKKADEKNTTAEEKSSMRIIPVKTMEDSKDMNQAARSTEKEGSLRTIPVKPIEEDKSLKKCNEGTKGNKAEKNTQTKQPVQTKAPTLPPVCLRVAPLPKKKCGKGSSRSPSPPAHKDQHADHLKPSSSVSEKKVEDIGSYSRPSGDDNKDKQLQREETRIEGNTPAKGAASAEALKPSSSVSEQSIEESGSNLKPSGGETQETKIEDLLSNTTGKEEVSVEAPNLSSPVPEQISEEGGRSPNSLIEDKPSQSEETTTEGLLGNTPKCDESLSGCDCKIEDQMLTPKLVSVEGTDMLSKVVTEETRGVEANEGVVEEGKTTDDEPRSNGVPKKSEEVINNPGKKSLSCVEAATIIQSAYRGYVVRKLEPLQKLRNIAKVRQESAGIRSVVESLQTGVSSSDPKQKLVLGESIMKLLFELDTIQGLHPTIRDIRKSAASELVHIQEKLDCLGLEQPGQSSGHKSSEPQSETEMLGALPQDLSISDEQEIQSKENPSDTCAAALREQAEDNAYPACTAATQAAAVEESQRGSRCEEVMPSIKDPDMSISEVLGKSSEEPYVLEAECRKVEDDVRNIGETCGHEGIPESSCEHDGCSLGPSNGELVVEETELQSSGKMDEDVNVLAELPVEAIEEIGDTQIFTAEEDQKVEQTSDDDLKLTEEEEIGSINNEKRDPVESTLNVEVRGEQDISNEEHKKWQGQADSSLKIGNDTCVPEGELLPGNVLGDDEVKEVIEASVEMNKERAKESEDEHQDHHQTPVSDSLDSPPQKETSEDAMPVLGDHECEPVAQTVSNVEEEPLTSSLEAEHKTGDDGKEKNVLEENEKLRDMLEKLIASGREQQKMIDSLSGKVKDLKGKLESHEKKKNKKAAKRVRVMMPRSRCRPSKDMVHKGPTGLVS